MENQTITFYLPDELHANAPPEKRGVSRDDVRLMVLSRNDGSVVHTRFQKLRDYLTRGDLLVFNVSRTLPASLTGCGDTVGSCIEVRLAEHLPDGSWLVLLLCRRGDPFICGLREGMLIDFSEDLSAVVLERHEHIPRLWKIRFSKDGRELIDMFYRLGKPIHYEYITAPWNLEYYQNVFARDPGSSEMPSAGRAFSWETLISLKRSGIELAYITLHAGLSSYMDDELDSLHLISEEEYLISEDAASIINKTVENGGRIIAIGTTVVRALESAASVGGIVSAGHRYTHLKITASHQIRIVNGLLTGFHEPGASHLDMLTAFVSRDKLLKAYVEAVKEKYLWHEFGDLNLII
jgi:S-adenosylmethionine:tRNA ribosyltransferase-isomerase